MSRDLGPSGIDGATSRVRRVRRALTASAALSCAFLSGGSAFAQQSMISGLVGAGTGFEGGGAGDGVSWQRARTRAVVGLDFAVDEVGYNAFGFRSFIELERRTSLGGSFFYTRWVAPKFGLFAGITGVAVPEQLFGGTAGALFLVPLGSKVDIFIEPSIAALPLGSDVPDDSVIVWALLSAGLRFDL